MKIIQLCAYFFPEVTAGSHLADAIREYNASIGNEFTVITPTPSRNISIRDKKKYKKLKKETLSNGKIKVRRFFAFDEKQNPKRRALRYFYCSIIGFFKLLFLKCDLLYFASTPPTNGFTGGMLKKLKGVPFVYAVQDIFPDSMVQGNLTTQKSFIFRLGRKMELFTYKNADKIIVISEDCKKNLLKKGVPESKLSVIYNWVDENTITPISRNNNFIFDEFHLDRKLFYITYAGNLGEAQDIDIILNVAKELETVTDIRFVIFGGGAKEQHYKKTADKLNLQNLHFFPLQSYDKVSYVYSLGNVSLVSCKNGFGKIALPSKTWSIMSAGTAVLASFDGGGDLERIITESKSGLFSESGNVAELKRNILQLYNNPKQCAEYGKNARTFIENNLTKEIGTKKYAAVFSEVYNTYYSKNGGLKT